MVLKISKDCIPFGNLTLLQSPIVIDNEKWKTPVNYIFANMFNSGMYYESLKNCNPVDISVFCDKYFRLNQMQIATKCIQDYIQIKLESNPQFQKELEDSRNKQLVFDSKKTPLFTKNIYGNILEQFRNQRFHDSANSDRKNDPIFYVYLAEKVLKEQLSQNNLQEYLDQKFCRMSDLLRYLERKLGRENVIRKSPDRVTILQIHKKLGVDYTTNPNTLIRLVRKKNIRRIYNMNMGKLKYALYEEFIQYHTHLYPDTYDKLLRIKADKETISFSETVKLVERIYNLYKEKQLPTNLLQIMDKRNNDFYIPTEKEMTAFEQDVFLLYPGPDIDDETSTTIANTTEQLYITKEMHSSPYAVDHITINKISFPTVVHYYVYNVIISEMKSKKDPKKILKTLFQYRTEELPLKLEEWLATTRKIRLEKLVNSTIYIFFKNDYHQHLLLATGNESIQIEPCIITNLNEIMTSIRNNIQPKIYRIQNMNQLKSVYLVAQWIQNMRRFVASSELIFNKWFVAKGSERKIGKEFIHHFLWNFLQHPLSDSDNLMNHLEILIDIILSKFKIYSNNVQVINFIIRMQYLFNNEWVKPKDYVQIIKNTSDNMKFIAIAKILLVFDKLIDVPITIDDIDLKYVKQLLTNYVEIETDYDSEMKEDSEMEYYDDDEEIVSDYEDKDFEGNDDIYNFLSSYCFNNLSDCIENSIYNCIKSLEIKNKSTINFFAGAIVRNVETIVE